MKKNVKLLTATLSAVMLFSVGSYALTGSKTIDVVFNNIKLMVNGREAVLTDSAGNTHEPFIYNGVVYAPLEATVNAVTKGTGLLPMEWNREASTYYIGEKVSSTGIVKIQDLTDFGQQPAGISNEDGKYTITIRGTTFTPYDIADVNSTGYWDDTYNGNIALDGKYSRITGKIASGNGSTHVTLIIIGDGIELARYEYEGNEPIDVDVNLVGVKTLQLNSYNPSGSGHQYFYGYSRKSYAGLFYDVKLEKVGQATN